MNPQKNQDYDCLRHGLKGDRKFQELEALFDKERPLSFIETPLGQRLQRYVNLSQIEAVLKKVGNWYNSLPSPGKAAVIIFAVLVGFSLLQSVLQLVTFLIRLAILGGILYLVFDTLRSKDAEILGSRTRR